MFDAFFVRRLKSPLAFAVKPLDAAGIKATQVTLIGAVIGLAAAILIAADALLLGGLLFLMNRLFDGLDGALARQQGPTEQGAFLDITLDFLIYSAIPFAFAVRDPDVALAAAFLLFSFVGTGSTFLAFSIFATRHGLENESLKDKSIYYLQGLTEGFETTLVLTLMCLFPQWFEWLAWGFGALCFMTTGSRIVEGNRVLRGISTPEPDRLSET
ncbi:MAG TPA: CDP-alcohol phosphatidyltransferase [Gammaproteobacteria bacterium]|nr:CDP-alcohol phosphatidyltransferase [Gammaproteobacteria bacterium]